MLVPHCSRPSHSRSSLQSPSPSEQRFPPGWRWQQCFPPLHTLLIVGNSSKETITPGSPAPLSSSSVTCKGEKLCSYERKIESLKLIRVTHLLRLKLNISNFPCYCYLLLRLPQYPSTTRYDLKQLIQFTRPGLFRGCHLGQLAIVVMPEKSIAGLLLRTDAGALVQRFCHHCVGESAWQRF